MMLSKREGEVISLLSHLRKVSITNLFILLKKFRTYSIITEALATEVKKNNTITTYTYHHNSFSHNSIPPHTQDIYCLIFSALSPVRYCAKFKNSAREGAYIR